MKMARPWLSRIGLRNVNDAEFSAWGASFIVARRAAIAAVRRAARSIPPVAATFA